MLCQSHQPSCWHVAGKEWRWQANTTPIHVFQPVSILPWTSMSFRDLPIMYETVRGSWDISLISGSLGIKSHFCMRHHKKHRKLYRRTIGLWVCNILINTTAKWQEGIMSCKWPKITWWDFIIDNAHPISFLIGKQLHTFVGCPPFHLLALHFDFSQATAKVTG